MTTPTSLKATGSDSSPMPAARTAAALFAAFAVLQTALAAGAPWGSVVWGGRFEGQLSTEWRVASAVAAVVLIRMALVVIAQGGGGVRLRFVSVRYPRAKTWAIAGLMAVNALGNLASQSNVEQFVFGPLTVVMAGLAATVAFHGRRRPS